MENYGILFQSFTFLFNIGIHFEEFILCHLCFFLSLIFDYWWLHVPKSFDVKQFRQNHGKIMEFCFKFRAGTLSSVPYLLFNQFHSST